MSVAAAVWPALSPLALAHSAPGGPSAPAGVRLEPCRLPGVAHAAQCGTVRRPLDPAAPQGTQIDVHFAVLPALARLKKPDAVFFLAGGPGQSAISLAGTLAGPMGRLANRRDVVLVDQRGTGRSAPLLCPEERAAHQPLRELADPQAQVARLHACAQVLEKLPHGDLRHYTTSVAMADLDAVRQALDISQVNLVGGSYGTRAALEYLRQFPQAVRRVVIDGVAPPDMVLPASFSTDAQAALERVFAACDRQSACKARHGSLRERWRELLASLPREVQVAHPLHGREERVRFTRESVAGLVRPALYVPTLASGLPHAIGEAAEGRFTPLVGLASALGGSARGPDRMSEGMHFAVICAEDGTRLERSTDMPGPDFADDFAQMYRRVCPRWPRAQVPEAFYQVPPSASAVLVISGGADPVTPPRHGERVTRALGPRARHVVVEEAGHGVVFHGCMRDVLFRFIDAESDDEALRVDASCAQRVPRPQAFDPPWPASAPSRAGAGVPSGSALPSRGVRP